MRFMAKKMTEKDAETLVSEIFTRGVGSFIDPNDSFRKKLIAKATGESKKEIIIKFGIDPNRPDIHLGHAVVIRKLRQLQDLGCKIVFLVGDFTAQIGDPTGKSKVRPEVDLVEITNNIQSYISQIPKILKIEPEEGEEKFVTRDANGFIVDSPWFSWMRNAEWFQGVTDISTEGIKEDFLNFPLEGSVIRLPKDSFVGKAWFYESTRIQNSHLKRKQIRGVTFINIMSILRKISFAQLIERDMFQERIKANEPLFMHEMLYPVIQGIDSDVLAEIYGSCDLEVGGTDQTFNLLMGRRVMEMTEKKEPQAALSCVLLVGLDGKEKMSKSLDNYIGITDEPKNMFGKIMSLPDTLIQNYFELCTFTPMDEVQKIMKNLESGKAHPKEVKMQLAQQIVEIYHGKTLGEEARDAFVNTFQNKTIPADIQEVRVKKHSLLSNVLVDTTLVASKTEFRRLIEEGAVRKDGEEKITDPFYQIEEEIVLKIGKHRFIKITVE